MLWRDFLFAETVWRKKKWQHRNCSIVAAEAGILTFASNVKNSRNKQKVAGKKAIAKLKKAAKKATGDTRYRQP